MFLGKPLLRAEYAADAAKIRKPAYPNTWAVSLGKIL
jgi:hypothetical protein